MYSDADLDRAVAAGIINTDQAAGIRRGAAPPAGASGVTAADGTSPGVAGEENFRLLTGFNDIFVTVAIALVIAAVGFLASAATDLDESRFILMGLGAAAVSWGLAEYFTRQRRMALPSIVLLINFVAGLFIGTAALATALMGGGEAFQDRAPIVPLLLGGAVAGLGAYAHWRRFRVPITVAVGVLALGVAAVGALADALVDGGNEGAVRWLILLSGLGTFALAMRWDVSDPERVTRRSDVAFWLHLLAAPLIAHALFTGIRDGNAGGGTALATVALYAVFAVVALAIDRRALLVSSLAYVLWALNRLFEDVGAVGVNVALAALVIGSALLTLSAFWQPIRARVLPMFPAGWRHRLPPAREPVLTPRPA